MNDTTTKRCEERVSDGSFRGHIFGRPVKRTLPDGREVCGVHGRAFDSREASYQIHVQQQDASKAAHDAARAGAQELAPLGIKAEPFYAPAIGSGVGRYTGQVVVDPAQVLAAIAAAAGRAMLTEDTSEGTSNG